MSNYDQEIPLDVTVTTSEVANGLQITPQGIILACEIPGKVAQLFVAKKSTKTEPK